MFCLSKIFAVKIPKLPCLIFLTTCFLFCFSLFFFFFFLLFYFILLIFIIIIIIIIIIIVYFVVAFFFKLKCMMKWAMHVQSTKPNAAGLLFVLRFYGPVNPMGSCRARSVYLRHTIPGRRSPQRLTSIVHILSPGTDNCHYWISGRKRMAVENISWSNLHEKMLPTRRGLIEPATSWSPVGRAWRPWILWADIEGPDQPALMRRLIWAFAVSKCHRYIFMATFASLNMRKYGAKKYIQTDMKKKWMTLTITTVWANSADDIWICFLILSEKSGFDV